MVSKELGERSLGSCYLTVAPKQAEYRVSVSLDKKSYRNLLHNT